MELKEYFSVVNKYKFLVIFILLLAGISAFLLSFFKPAVYDASVSFAVNRINREITTQYEYDGYYAIQASDLVSQTVVSWFSTPSVVKEIYAEAGINPDLDSLNEYANLFNTKKYSGQNIGVKFTMAEKSTAEKLALAMIDVISKKVADLNKTADTKALFEAVASPVVIVTNKPKVFLITLIGSTSGLIIGLFLAYFIYYLKSEKKESHY
ncbi:MAG: Wzz/FepE/Etk N-terminal domain-containing protein [Patescibacteria group bacterium]